MERTMSVEEKIRRAEEKYNQKRDNIARTTSARVNVNSKKDIKLLKKMIIQVIVCMCIYSIVSTINSNQYIFSEDFINKTKELLSYDTNFMAIYENIKNGFQDFNKKLEEYQNQQNGIGGAEENIQAEQNIVEENLVQENNVEENVVDQTTENNNQENEENANTAEEVSQMDKDVQHIKDTISFIKPIEGVISSKYGQREPTVETVPKNHTGLDIAAKEGTVIKSATDGEVILKSSEGDYGNHLKIKVNDIIIIYAHCKTLYVNEGDKITQGQEIAEVGSTGNSTGPHLHFEIRIEDRTVDPQLILDI